MSDIIHLLPDSVANQIAAGEVIQRPASAVKELLENAIDAGGDEIKLIIKDAGKTLIQVIDNGCGMSETDARMSFERHATSKIQNVNDLFAIRSMGFRGEALASIAAIAQVELKTKRVEDELGTCIEIEGSAVKNQGVCNFTNGTSISIKNLFFNVPARRKFLKSNSTETRHIIDEFYRIALGNPNIALSMYQNNKLLFKLNKSNLKQRIVALFGSYYNQRLVPVEQKNDIVNITGFIGKPQFAKKTRGEQYFFANNRFIKHPYLHHSVDNAFRELLPANSFPTYFINLEVDPETIDINIHPTKTEINFQHNQIIYSFLRASIKQSLGKFSVAPTIDFDVEQSLNIKPISKNEIIKQPTIKIDTDYNPFDNFTKKPSEKKLSTREISNKENWTELYDNTTDKLPEEESTQIPFQSDQNDNTEYYTNIFQLHNKYIISNIKSGIMVIDQQKAHERILFERYMEMLDSQKGISQQQLFPQTIKFSASDAELINELKNDIRILGFEINDFGKNTFIINGTPADMPEKSVEELLENILENYKKNMIDLKLDKKINLARSMAINMSIKPGKNLQQEEIKNLVKELFTCKVPDSSPDGKPTLTIITVEELEKIFK